MLHAIIVMLSRYYVLHPSCHVMLHVKYSHIMPIPRHDLQPICHIILHVIIAMSYCIILIHRSSFAFWPKFAYTLSHTNGVMLSYTRRWPHRSTAKSNKCPNDISFQDYKPKISCMNKKSSDIKTNYTAKSSCSLPP